MFKYGNVTPAPQMEVVSLDWKHIPFKEDGRPANLPKSSGVYAFQGCHDSSSAFGVLYVGKAQVLADRVPQSLCERLFWKNGRRVELYSDVWHASLHVAAVLIASHAPAFNNAGVRGSLLASTADLRNLLVLNCGRKGTLLPTVFGGYYVDDLWP